MQIRLFKTESFRLTAIFAAVFVGAMLILMALVYVIMHQAFRAELLASTDQDLASIEKGYAAEGISEAEEIIAQRLVRPAASDYFILERTTGQKLAGNLPFMAPATGEQVMAMPATLATPEDTEEGHRIIGKGIFLAPGLYAFAGHDLFIASATEEQVLYAFAWVLAATLLLAVAGGIFLSSSFLKRMDVITQTCRAIMAGRLSDRIPERGTQDELDRLASTVNAMLDRISALMENVRQISSDIAHDLRTPLTRLRHRLDLARNEASTVEEYSQAVDQAIGDSDNVLSIFAALLRIGQIESSAAPRNFEPVDLSELLEQLAEIYRPVAEDAGHTLTAAISPNITVPGDRELLSQMFVNLIENAVTHTPPGTAITAALTKSEDTVAASVSDNGPGIPAKEREKVFRRFYRLAPARSQPGSGLGLSLVAAIADYHNGTVALYDNNPGMRVVVTLSGTGDDACPSEPTLRIPNVPPARRHHNPSL